MPSSRFSGLYFSGRTFAVLVVIVAVVGTMAFYRTHTSPAAFFGGITRSTEPSLSASQVPNLTALSKEQEVLAERVKPAVVEVQVTARDTGDDDRMGGIQGLPPDNPLSQFFGRQAPRGPRYEQGLGSGIIISPDGYIVTNNHVVKGATNIRVTLADSRTFKANVVGTDELTDLAVIKIDASGLPNLPWGDSKAAKQGDLVFAFGNPFQLFFTMTHGIVSAKGQTPLGARSNLLAPGDYIETDAVINPGNSGGPLVNVRGEVIGVNAFIYTSTGSFSGESFAIPSTIAQPVTDALIKNGKVVRGYLGITIRTLTPDLAPFFQTPANTQGALVSSVSSDSPGARAGLKDGDVIVSFNGQSIHDPTELQLATGEVAPGSQVKLKILRDGKPMTLTATLGFEPGEQNAAASNGNHALPSTGAHLGVRMEALTPQMREQNQIPTDVQGAMITGVVPGGPAFNALLQPGEVITSINRVPVTSADAVSAELAKLPPDKDILLRIYIGGSQPGGSYVVVHPEPSTGGGPGGGGR
ncbi:MAG: Do family serine endopeptidase [Terriglobales bacterium]